MTIEINRNEDGSYALTAEGVSFLPTTNAAALGMLAFAFEAEHALRSSRPISELTKWSALQWCKLLGSHISGLEPMSPESLSELIESTCELAPSPAEAQLFRRAFQVRYYSALSACVPMTGEHRRAEAVCG